jgi:hypothetical protein
LWRVSFWGKETVLDRNIGSRELWRKHLEKNHILETFKVISHRYGTCPVKIDDISMPWP